MRGLGLCGRAVLAAVLMAGSVTAQQKGTFTDRRDKQTYKTVKIGKQTWMAENINYQTESGSWCYNDSASYCKKYGRLYDWKTATTVCPKGWKLPSREDWGSLVQAVGGKRTPDEDGNIYWHGAGKKLKSKSGWNNRDDGESGNGTDDYGFSALPGGYRYPDGSLGINSAGNYGYWWTTTEVGFNELVSYWYINDDMDDDFGDKSDGFSVRCLADT